MDTLINYLEQAVAAGLKLARRPQFGFGPDPSGQDEAKEIVSDLLRQAMATGLPIERRTIDSSLLGGGNTADIVRHIVLHAPFVFKMDRNEKLAKEGAIMRDIRANAAMPARFREAWPVVYAIRETAPYAYLMEYFPEAEGWISLEDRLFPKGGAQTGPAEAVRLMHAVLDILFEGYDASIDHRMLPSIGKDYVERIRERLEAAEKVDAVFRSRKLYRGDAELTPWKQSLERIAGAKAQLDAIAAPFSTIVHGDPNPGNLMLRTSHSSVEVKLIDPKDWGRGDYLFDIAKITHFLDATGPIEKPAAGATLTLSRKAVDGGVLDYAFETPAVTSQLVAACLERVGQFAETHGDLHWRERYELAMAANILGLPATRFAHKINPRPDAAIALYGEGLTWLDRFCSRLK